MLNGVNDCHVRVKLSNYIQLTAKLSVSVSDFYNNNGPTTFLTNICAFLGIDTGRLKIVSVRSGSTDITFFISPQPVASNSTQNTTTDPAASNAALTSMASTLSTGLTSSSLNVGYPVISHDVSVAVFNADGTVYTPTSTEEKNNMIILVTVIPISVIIVAVIGWICVRRMRSKIYTHEILGVQSSQIEIT